MMPALEPPIDPTVPWRDGASWTNAATGVTLTVERATNSTAGAALVVIASFPPGSPEPPLHYHPQQTERFSILSGRLHVRHESTVKAMQAGDVFVVQPREDHAMWNPFSEPALARWETSPAMQTERWMGMLIALAAAGKTNSSGVPRPLQLALLLHTFRNEIRLTKPPSWIQAIVMPLLATGAKLRGLRADRVKS